MANEKDSDELEMLFDSILAAQAGDTGAVQSVEGDKVINSLGHMARTLHNTLRELGLNKEIEKVVSSTIPDARDRLNYVAMMTQQAAERVLNATDTAQPIIEKLGNKSAKLSGQWQMLFDRKLDVEQFKHLVMQTRDFLDNEVPSQARATNAHLMEIMMAQDFQDLTGQVIKKIVDVTQKMEQQLVQLLLESAPAHVKSEFGGKAEFDAGLLNGPVINAAGRSDVVTSQDQVDDLLASLGF